MQDLVRQQSYTRQQALRLLDISERQLRGWERSELISPAETFSFSDLIALRTLAKLRQSRIPAARIRSAVNALRAKMRDVTDPLKELKVFSDGRRIHVEVAGQHMEPVSGQLLFNFTETDLKRLLSFPRKASADPRAQKQTAERWFQKGLELEQGGAPVEDAIHAYETAVRLDAGSAGALVNLGTIYFNGRRYALAESYYKKALEADSSYALAHFNIANLYDEKGNRHKALFHYKSAVEINGNYADAHYNLALLHQGEGRVMEAVRHWQIYLKLDAGSPWGEIARRELDKLRSTTVLKGSRRPPLPLEPTIEPAG